MAQASASVAYIAAAANRFPYTANISPESLVAFGSHKFVSLWDLNHGSIRTTLPGHGGVVTCLCFVNESRFVSGDDIGILRCWEGSGSQWSTGINVQAHPKSISCMAYSDGYLVTGSSDSTVKVWIVDPKDHTGRVREKQTIKLGARYPLAVQITRLPRSNALVLAVSGTFTEVKIYTCSEELFLPVASLPGHEDWVKCLAFHSPRAEADPLILASGSQDATIRLWNIEPLKFDPTARGDDELLDSFEASLGDTGEGEEGGKQISLKRHIVSVRDPASPGDVIQKYSIIFDALLVGHESGVTSLSWGPDRLVASSPVLLSTSTDSSLILWSPFDSLWVNRNRFGDIGGQRLGGFVGGLWNTNGEEILAWGWNGGWRRWKHDSNAQRGGVQAWTEANAVTGHNNVVKDICWSPQGEFLASTSLDQTTRIHGPLPSKPSNVWREIARPQVHGYDLIGVQFLDALKFISIADEKVARVFEAPKGFVRLVKNLQVTEIEVDEDARPVGATVPPLGLSNKAVSEVAMDPHPAVINRPPFEGELAFVTLWPEIEKVFGHGYESISIATSTSKAMFASTCKSTSPIHAVVRINSVQDNYRSVGIPLDGHSLTVTRVAFSPPDDKYILSVSRDRSWRLYEGQGDCAADPKYTFVAADKSHTRIIWDCAWSAEGDIFATASRDKTVKIWKNMQGKWTAVTVIKTADAATAVAFSPTDYDQRRRVAIGLENGYILIYSSSTNPSEWELELTIDSSNAHVDQIHRVAWRPLGTKEEGGGGIIKKQLASCSEDHTLRILNVLLKV